MTKLIGPPTVPICMGTTKPLWRPAAKYLRLGVTNAPATAPMWQQNAAAVARTSVGKRSLP